MKSLLFNFTNSFTFMTAMIAIGRANLLKDYGIRFFTFAHCTSVNTQLRFVCQIDKPALRYLAFVLVPVVKTFEYLVLLPLRIENSMLQLRLFRLKIYDLRLKFRVMCLERGIERLQFNRKFLNISNLRSYLSVFFSFKQFCRH